MRWHSLLYYPLESSFAALEGASSAVAAMPSPAQAKLVICDVCEAPAYWVCFTVLDGKQLKEQWRQVRPAVGQGPAAHAEMPSDVRSDYDEARTLVGLSPRAACALLRLALQKLCVHLGQAGKNINDDIGALVKGGLPADVQRALDVLRVVGNNALHPGELDLKDDVQTATGLFGVLNFIVDNRIAQPRAIEAMYAKLPEGALDAIARRDARST